MWCNFYPLGECGGWDALIFITTENWGHSGGNAVQKYFLWVFWCSYEHWFRNFCFLSACRCYVGDVLCVTRTGFPYVISFSFSFFLICWHTRASRTYFCCFRFLLTCSCYVGDVSGVTCVGFLYVLSFSLSFAVIIWHTQASRTYFLSLFPFPQYLCDIGN